MLIDKKYPAVILLIIMIVLLAGCNKEEASEAPAEVESSPVTAAPVSETPPQPPQVVTLTAEQRDARKAERQTKREQRLAELTPEELAAREAKREARRLAKQENPSDSEETEADKQARRAERRRQNLNQRTQDKAWWNKGGNKLAALELSDQQKTDMDSQLQTLLDTREQLGAELQPLWASNRDALASGNVGLIASNLENIDRLETQWQTERRNAMVEILESLDSQQMAALAQSSSDISSLNWLDIDLSKGIERPQTDRQQQRQNRRQNGKNNSN